MAESYPKKYWWLILVVLPVVLALIAIIPNISGGGSSGTDSGNRISIDDSTIGGDVQIVGTQTIFNELGDSIGDPDIQAELEARINRAVNLARGGFFEESLEAFRELATEHPSPSIYANIGQLSLQENNLDNAREAYREAFVLAPEDPDVLLGLSQVYQAEGNTGEAARLLESSNNRNLNRLATELREQLGSGAIENEPNDLILTPNNGNITESIQAAFSAPSDVDFYRFVTPSSPRDWYRADVTNRSTGSAIQVKIWNANKQQFGESAYYGVTPGQDVSHGFSQGPDTEFFISVHSTSGAGPYTMTVTPRNLYDKYEPNDTILTAFEAEDSRLVEGNIMDKDDVDYFHLRTSASSVQFFLENQSLELSPQIKVYDSNKSLINESAYYGVTAGQDISLVTEIANSADYFLAIHAIEASGGSYALTINPQ